MGGRGRALIGSGWGVVLALGGRVRFQVPYRADGWRRLSPHPSVPGELQIVEQNLGENRTLHVELLRAPDAVVRVAIARLRIPYFSQMGRMQFQNIILTAEQLELVEAIGDD